MKSRSYNRGSAFAETIDHTGFARRSSAVLGRSQRQITSTTPFSGFAHAAWNSGRVGFIYAEKSDVVRDFGAWNEGTRRRSTHLLKGEVPYYSSYLSGDGYRFDLREDGDLIDPEAVFLAR